MNSLININSIIATFSVKNNLTNLQKMLEYFIKTQDKTGKRRYCIYENLNKSLFPFSMYL